MGMIEDAGWGIAHVVIASRFLRGRGVKLQKVLFDKDASFGGDISREERNGSSTKDVQQESLMRGYQVSSLLGPLDSRQQARDYGGATWASESMYCILSGVYDQFT